MKGQLNPMIALMVAIVVGVAMAVPVIVDVVSLSTEAQTITNEALNITNASVQTLAQDDLASSSVVITNGTTTIGSGNYTVDTTAGTITFTAMDNSVYGTTGDIDYSYYDSSYQDNSTNRTITGMIPLLIAVAIVLFVVGYMRLS